MSESGSRGPDAPPPEAARPTVRAMRPAAVGPPVEQMTAGKLAELLQDVEAATPVWQIDEDDKAVPVYFVEINRVNGFVERLIIK